MRAAACRDSGAINASPCCARRLGEDEIGSLTEGGDKERRSSRSDQLLFVLFGPGGAGKGTVADCVAAADPTLHLSRSWTTRQKRPGERDDAYVFVDRLAFESQIEAGAFFEWAEFLGNLYGTPVPVLEEGGDVLLEIDLQGALQVKSRRPDATLILLMPPSPEAQAKRLRARGDEEGSIAERLRTGEDEARRGRSIADAVVVNDDVNQAAAEVAGIVEQRRLAAGRGPRVG